MTPVFVTLGERWVGAAHSHAGEDAISAISFPARIALGHSPASQSPPYIVQGAPVAVGGPTNMPGSPFAARQGTTLAGPHGLEAEDALLVLHALHLLGLTEARPDVVVVGFDEAALARLALGFDTLATHMDTTTWPAALMGMSLASVFAQAQQLGVPDPQCVMICDERGGQVAPVTDGPALSFGPLYGLIESALLDYNEAVHAFDPAALAYAWGDQAAVEALPPAVASALDECVRRAVVHVQQNSTHQLAALRVNYRTVVLVGPDARLMAPLVKAAGVTPALPQWPDRSLARYALRAYLTDGDTVFLYTYLQPGVGHTPDRPRTRPRQPVIVRVDTQRETVTLRLSLSSLDPTVRDLLTRFAISTKPGQESEAFLHSIIEIRRR